MQNEVEKFSTPLEIDMDLMEDQIKCMVFRMRGEIAQLEKRTHQLRTALTAIQAICYHRFEPAGTTHGGNHEKCTLCGFEQRN